MVKSNENSLFSVELPDGTTLDYPATYTPQYLVAPGAEPEPIKMLPVGAGVEEQAFSIVGKLMDEIPDLEASLNALLEGGVTSLKHTLTVSQVVQMVKSGVESAPVLLIELGAVLSELEVEAVRKKLTLAELVEMVMPVVFLEKYRFTTSMGNVLERLGFDLDELDAEEEAEPVTVEEALDSVV